MKILQIASIFPVADAPRENPYVLQFISKYLEKHDAEMEVIKPVAFIPKILTSFSKKKDYWQQKRYLCRTGEYQLNNIKITIWPYLSIGSVSGLHTFLSSLVLWWNRKKLKQVDRDRFDLVHAHFLFPDGMIAYQLYKKFGIPYILTLQQELRFLENCYSLRWVKKIICKASAVTTLSPQMAEGLKVNGIKKVQVVPLGIEEYFFDKILGTQILLGKEKKLKLLSVCNLLPVKNLGAAIRAIGKLPEKDQIKFAVYGTGPEEEKLKTLVGQLQLDDIVQFKGAVANKELLEIMPQYDVFIQPSFKETLGLSYFEALACGLPVILTKNTGAYEMIKEKDVYYLVDPHDPQSITGCLYNILQDRKALTNKANLAPEVAKIASWERFVEFFHEKYEEVVSTRSTPCPP